MHRTEAAEPIGHIHRLTVLHSTNARTPMTTVLQLISFDRYHRLSAMLAGQIDDKGCPSLDCKAGHLVTCVVSIAKQRKLYIQCSR